VGRWAISILLASDDIPFVDQLSAAAAERGLALHRLTAETDVDVALARHGANVYVVDADAAPRRGARSATAFAARHPDIPVILLADDLEKRGPTERLLGAIERAYAEQRSTI
jgi:DNA-binding NtrC family response regulator